MEKLEISKKVQYLLENDRYICAPDLYDVGNWNNEYMMCPIADGLQVCGGRFFAPQLATSIFYRYFDGKKKVGCRDPDFIVQINGVFISLFATAIYHCLKIWESRVPDPSPPEFKPGIRIGMFMPAATSEFY